ncbi:GNAT family N-acetyltransferase [Streptomyces corynorhini]|uniref:GNAT family N-acetyltransferase n=1 Tax=Streptomyces corynorhini TaxID=2282652 RepID=A0A370BGD7_9ACTN|nr:GNAT family N-acetyltransferase [Streptomyces corynorhini]RDG39722.1 GNAT family N-acetyltransferase [Streptomyces corynorhini]
MTTELRVLRPAEWASWFGALELAFGGVPETGAERALWRDLTEFERSLGVWDGEECVGTAGAFSFRLSVPGGALVPTAGVTMVSVAATYRRRGVLTSMMRRQLDDVRTWGEPLAVLTASEPEIYGRFGYGLAAQQLTARIDTSRVRIAPPAAPEAADGSQEVRLRRVKPDDPAVREACEAVYAAQVAGRPGMLARRPGWERLPVLDGGRPKDGASPLQCVLAERHGEVVGFTLFRNKPEWDMAGPKGTIELGDLYARDAAAYVSLWRFLFSIDLTSTVLADNRPPDDPFQYVVSDVRRCALRLRDSLYLRPVEVGAALEARTYRAPVDVVLGVEDAFCPWNEGNWRLSGDAKGASCERTADRPDLTLGVRELAAAYLGGTSLAALARAGRVREVRTGALAEASTAFGSDVAPWLPHGF